MHGLRLKSVTFRDIVAVLRDRVSPKNGSLGNDEATGAAPGTHDRQRDRQFDTNSGGTYHEGHRFQHLNFDLRTGRPVGVYAGWLVGARSARDLHDRAGVLPGRNDREDGLWRVRKST